MTTLEVITAGMEASITEDINSTPTRRTGVAGLFQRLAAGIASFSRKTVSAVRDDDFPAATRHALGAVAGVVLWVALAGLVVLALAVALSVVVTVGAMWLMLVAPFKVMSRGRGGRRSSGRRKSRSR